MPITATCGTSDAGCLITSNTATPGKVGVTVTPATQLAAGARNIAVVTFTTFANEPANTPITFGVTPTGQSITDALGNPLPFQTTNGMIVFGNGKEGDIVSHPNGDGVVNTQDIIGIARIVAGLDTLDPTTNEFQRADCAPSGTQGNGVIDAGDVVEASRYNANLDTIQTAGGPFSPLPAPPPLTRPESQDTAGARDEKAKERRTVKVLPTSASPGSSVAVSVELNSEGNEVATSFTLNFDPARLSINSTSSPDENPDITLGTGAPAGSGITINATQAAEGRIGYSGIQPEPCSVRKAVTSQQVVTLNFHVATDAPGGDVPITFDDSTAPRSISDANGETLQTRYTAGAINIFGAAAQGVSLTGRLTTQDGRGIRGAVITLTDSLGQTRQAASGASGSYRFDGLDPAETYTISVASKSYRFPTRTVTGSDNLSGVDLIALE